MVRFTEEDKNQPCDYRYNTKFEPLDEVFNNKFKATLMAKFPAIKQNSQVAISAGE